MSRTILSILAAIGTLLVTAAQAYHSSTPHPFREASIEWIVGGRAQSSGRPLGVPLFVGHDGEEYTHLEGDVLARFRIKARVKAFHRIYSWIVTTGDPKTRNLSSEFIGAQDATYVKKLESSNIIFAMDAVTAVETGIPGISINRAQEVIDKCNNEFVKSGKVELPGSDQAVDTIHLHVHFGARSGKWQGMILPTWGTAWPGDPGSPAVAHTTFPVRIICRGEPAEIVSAPKPENVDIRVTPTGETCPNKTEVTAYVDYEEKATPRIRAVRQGHVGRTPPWVEVATREVTFGPKTWHRAERTFEFNLDPGKHTFRIEVQNGPDSHWETVEIDCPPFAVVFTSLEYEAEDKQTCPKLVEESVVFTTNGPGEIEYAIKPAGTDWVVRSGSVEATRQGDEYRAVVENGFPQNAVDVFMSVAATAISGPNEPGPLANANARMKVECLELVESSIDLRDEEAPACPRHAEAGIALKTNAEGEVPYELVCTGEGRSWSGTAKASRTGPDTYLAVAVHSFSVTKTEKVVCRVRSALTQGKPTAWVLQGRDYACVRTAVPSGPGGITGPPSSRPQDSPPKVVDPTPPQLACAGGAVKDGECTCPRTHRAVQASENDWRCIPAVAVDPPGPKATAVPRQPRITCAGGSVRDGKCVCERGFNARPAGANAFRCVRTATVPAVKTPAPAVKRAVPRAAPTITCVGGSVRNGKCDCKRGFAPVPAGVNAFRCVRTATVPAIKTPPPAAKRAVPRAAPTIACRGGVVRAGRCVCPSGSSLKNGACTATSSVPLQAVPLRSAPSRAQ